MRILICGATGMIGHKVWQTLTGAHEVMATLRRGRDEAPALGLFGEHVVEHVEAGDLHRVTAVLNQVRPAVVVNCLGITKRKPEAGDVSRMFRVNTLFPHHLARWGAEHGSRVIHFSTDCVFGGDEGNYHERSVVTADDLYGQTKYFGELDYDHCLTIRTSMIGRELSGRTELLEWFLAQSGKTITGFTRARYSGLTTNEMARIIGRIITDHPRLYGKYQVAGPSITKHDLLCKVRDAFGIDVRITPSSDFVCDRTLQSHRFETATGLTVPPWDDMVADLAAERAFYDEAAQPSGR